jgi:hypothetical protein
MGSALFLRKLRPFKSVPAGTEERTIGDSVLLGVGFRPWPMGETGNGVVNGCVAEDGVDGVADGTFAGCEGELVRWRREKRGDREVRDARRRQRRQIMMRLMLEMGAELGWAMNCELRWLYSTQ